jgi:hypothetical protein
VSQQCVCFLSACSWWSSGPGVPMAVQGTALVGNKMFALASMVGLGEPPIAQPVSTSYTIIISVDACHFIHYILPSTGTCPSGLAWADKAYSSDKAHQEIECSNAGICDRASGTCKCVAGFTGNACQRSKPSLSLSLYVYVDHNRCNLRYISTCRSLSQRVLRTWDMQLHW